MAIETLFAVPITPGPVVIFAVSACNPHKLNWVVIARGCGHFGRQRRLAAAQEVKQRRNDAAAAETARAAAAAEAVRRVAAAERQATAGSAGPGSEASDSDGSGDDGEVQYASELHRQMALLQVSATADHCGWGCSRLAAHRRDGNDCVVEARAHLQSGSAAECCQNIIGIGDSSRNAVLAYLTGRHS